MKNESNTLRPATITLDRDFPRRALGLSKTQWRLFLKLKDIVFRAQVHAISHKGRAREDATMVRYFAWWEIQDLVGGSPTTTGEAIDRFCELGILTKRRRAEVKKRRDFDPHLEYLPEGTKRTVYEFNSSAMKQVPNALASANVGDFLAVRLAEGGRQGRARVLTAGAPDLLGPDVFLVEAIWKEIALSPEKHPEVSRALAALVEAADGVMRAYARRTFEVTGKQIHHRPQHWWENMGAPLLVVDFSSPPYSRVAVGSSEGLYTATKMIAQIGAALGARRAKRRRSTDGKEARQR